MVTHHHLTILQWGLGIHPGTGQQYRTPSKDMQVGAISQQNSCPRIDVSTSEYMLFDDVLGRVACASFAPDPYTLVICLQGKSRLIRENNFFPI